MRIAFWLLLIPVFAGCSMETFNMKGDLDNRTGFIQIHRCFCGESAYSYLIMTADNRDTLLYNPINLPEDYKDDSYKIAFSANLLNDSSIVYTNTPTDAVIPDFKVRNIKLTAIRKCSDLILNDTIGLIYGKTYRNYEKNISIKLDSVTEDSRCPYNVECLWEGNATAKFKFFQQKTLSVFFLNTSGGFVRDTIISGYKIQFIYLKPYPVFPNPIHQTDYMAGIKITI